MITYVGVPSFSKATEIRHIALGLVSRWRTTTAGGLLRDRRGRSLGRSHTRVGGRRTEPSLRLARGASSSSSSAHIGRARAVESELKILGTTSASGSDVARETTGGDGHRGLASVRISWSPPIDDGDARGRFVVLHGLSVHWRYRTPLILCWAAHVGGGGGRRGLLGRGVGVRGSGLSRLRGCGSGGSGASGAFSRLRRDRGH